MGDGTLGEIRIFSGTFLPKFWTYCDGSIIPIMSNSPLFAILGTRFGGDGTRTFAMPKMADPAPGLKFIICVSGLFPAR